MYRGRPIVHLFMNMEPCTNCHGESMVLEPTPKLIPYTYASFPKSAAWVGGSDRGTNLRAAICEVTDDGIRINQSQGSSRACLVSHTWDNILNNGYSLFDYAGNEIPRGTLPT
jgi:hypothetical protein